MKKKSTRKASRGEQVRPASNAALGFSAGPWHCVANTVYGPVVPSLRLGLKGHSLQIAACHSRSDDGTEDEILPSQQESHANALLVANAPELLTALQLHLAFLDSLPRGWLAHTVADIGMLNDAYLASTKVLRQLRLKP